MDLLCRVLFINHTAGTEYTIITKTSTVPLISEWYASHHAGDKFKVYVGGRLQKLDKNGVVTDVK